MKVPQVTITAWKPSPSLTRVGFVSLRFPDIGLTIRTCAVQRFTTPAGIEQRWLAYPSAAYFDTDGHKREYATIFFTRHIHEVIADSVFAELAKIAPKQFAPTKAERAA